MKQIITAKNDQKIIRNYYQQYYLLLYKIAQRALYVHYTSILEANDLIVNAVSHTPRIISEYNDKYGTNLNAWIFYSWRNIMLHELQKDNNVRNKFAVNLVVSDDEDSFIESFVFDDNFQKHVQLLYERKLISKLAQEVIKEVIQNDLNFSQIKKLKKYNSKCISKIKQDIRIAIEAY